jgi:DNA-nicking Smr family endonuclease
LSREDEEERLFKDAMKDVVPLADRGARVRSKRRPAKGAGLDDDTEVLGQLRDIVRGRAPLDFNDSDEFIEWRHPDCAPRELEKIKVGALAVQAHLDLHGKSREDAREAVERFLREALARGQRCVLIVCGRGLHTPGRRPVLKVLLAKWLTEGRFSRAVLAYASARPHDGGVGSIYVLLRTRGAAGVVL